MAGTRVHGDGPADSPGDPHAELDARKRVGKRLPHELGEEHPCPHRHPAIIEKDEFGELPAQLYDTATIARIRDEHVRALAQDDPLDVLTSEHLKRPLECGVAVDTDEEVSRATDAIRRPVRELFLPDHLSVIGARK